MARSEQRSGGGGGRMFGLGLLAAIVALAILYFGNCVPGFGAGGTSSPATDAPAAPKSVAAPVEATDTIPLSVDGERCRRDSDALQPCAELCAALAGEAKTRKILVDGTLGTHAAVDGLRRCLGEQGFRDVVVRAE
ncbi:MAG: hypothetical protein JNK45_28200 [Myxococcales bacterium]|nr:hypothetical protein [Myxococcales bacterium]